MSQRPGTIMELLRLEGIRTKADFYAWLKRRARAGRSNYGTLCDEFGQVNADRIMRVIEVAEWDLEVKSR